jgi:uncharacterized protein (DUF1501 family)
MAITRREFLCRSLGAFGAAMLGVERFGLLNALAQSADYRALVCIFLNGGNDGGNMVIPYDDYGTYAAAREPSGLAIPQSSLLRTGPVPRIGAEFGFHPSLTGLHELWGQGKVAVICNVGPLVEPTNRDTYRNRTVRVPLNLFSHSDQINQWQTSVAEGSSPSGWGGRTADKIGDLNITVRTTAPGKDPGRCYQQEPYTGRRHNGVIEESGGCADETGSRGRRLSKIEQSLRVQTTWAGDGTVVTLPGRTVHG